MKKFIFFLAILTMGSCTMLNDIFPTQSTFFYKIDGADLNDWEEGFCNDSIYVVAAKDSISNNYVYLINNTNYEYDDGLLVELNSSLECVSITYKEYQISVTYPKDNTILFSGFDENGSFFEEIIVNAKFDNRQSVNDVITKSNVVDVLLNPETINAITSAVQYTQHSQAIGNDIKNAMLLDFLIDLSQLGVDILFDLTILKGHPIAGTIISASQILYKGMEDSQASRNREQLYGSAYAKIEDIDFDENGNINIYVTVYNCNTIPSHLYHLYYKESDEEAINNVYCGIVGRKTFNPNSQVYTKPYKEEVLIEPGAYSESYYMFVFPMPDNEGTYLFRPYLKSTRLASKNGKVSEKYIKYGDSFEYNPYDGLRRELINLYNNTNGDKWINNTNWCTDLPISTWYGVSLYEFEDYYKEGNDLMTCSINLSHNNLSGNVIFNTDKINVMVDLNVENNRISTIKLNGMKGDIRFNNNPELTSFFAENVKIGHIFPEGIPSLEEISLKNSCSDYLFLDNHHSFNKISLYNCETDYLFITDNDNLETIQVEDSETDYWFIVNNTNINHITINSSTINSYVLISDCSSLDKLTVESSRIKGYFDCEGNNLTSISLFGSIIDEGFDCSNNKLKSLDLMSFKAESISCTNNQINSVIPSAFNASCCKSFFHDEKYTHYYYDHEGVLHYTTHDYGWWQSGEPKRGYHRSK